MGVMRGREGGRGRGRRLGVHLEQVVEVVVLGRILHVAAHLQDEVVVLLEDVEPDHVAVEARLLLENLHGLVVGAEAHHEADHDPAELPELEDRGLAPRDPGCSHRLAPHKVVPADAL